MGHGILGFIFGGIGGFLAGLLVGALLILALGVFQSGGVSIPFDQVHARIANNIIVRDITIDKVLSLKHVQTSLVTITRFKPLDLFTEGETYTQSLWIFTRDGDIEVTMTIFGALNDKKSYLCEFGKHAGNAININGFGNDIGWPPNSEIGTASFVVEVSD